MANQHDKARAFLALHRPGNPLLLPNPWDPGSARILASLGFEALATTSSHSASIVASTPLPVSADLEKCFADEPEGVAETITLAARTGLAGCSIEDYTGDEADPIYEITLAAQRVGAAAAAAHSRGMVLTARCENHLHGRHDLGETIARLQAYAQAGADVLYAPGVRDLTDIRRIVAETDRPVNVLAMSGMPPVSELASAGVSRVSVGGAFAFCAYGALAQAATELRTSGSYEYGSLAAAGRDAVSRAFS
jgi:2-methylisocitrate lyase-like PEP mutase family enzyme